MQELLEQSKTLSVTNPIDRIEDKSCSLMNRVRVYFKNGISLSVIQGEYSHGGDEGLFEIAIFSPDGEMNGDLFDEYDRGDDVLGYCSAEKVKHYINKLSNM